MKDKEKEFRPTSWSIDNKSSIFIITIIITLMGIISYINLPKEKFPDIVVPTIYVSTVYPGTSPKDMENLVTKPIEKQIKAISGVKKLTSNSVQDFSNLMVEFDTDVDVPIAKQKVKDAVDKARNDLPNDLPREPSVMELDFSEFPIMQINISGDYDLKKLKQYAEEVEDKVETLKEITRVDIVGALDREIQINVNKYKMEAANVSMRDIESAVAMENMTISGGQVDMDEMKRSISVSGEFTDVNELNNIVIRSASGAVVYLRDIAEIKDSFKEKESYARLDHKNVITLNVVKRSGENLILASDKIRDIVKEMEETRFPENLKITLTGDQSTQTRVTLHDLINTIIIGFVLVTLILMFFMGVTNALFVALSVPLSMFVAFMVFPSMGFALNMIVLFAFLLALGIVVDDAIVVIENTHRIFDNGKVPIKKAAKIAAGEIFLPVLAGTLTTLAPFVPLAFWGGIIGKFMFYLPVTLIVTLLASLLVAYIINPVFAVQFMKPHNENPDAATVAKSKKGFRIITVIMFMMAVIFYIAGVRGLGNFVLFIWAFIVFHKLVLEKVIKRFQSKTWPSIQDAYARTLSRALVGKRPVYLLVGTFVLFIFSFVLTGIAGPKVVFFPSSDPNFVNAYLTLPIGTDQHYTDSIVRIVEDRVYKVVGEENPMVESVIANVGIGASEQQDDRGVSPHKGKVTVAFVEFAKRDGRSTAVYLDEIREAVKGIPGAEITVSKEASGPPVGKAVNIEILGEEFEELNHTAESLKKYLDSLQITGVEELKSDLQSNKPEVVIDINRERANREGISTAQIGLEIRNAVFGKEVSKFRDVNDEYPIQLRFEEYQRNNLDALLNTRITYRDMNMGGAIRQVPLSAVADIHYASTYGGIKRKNQKRIVTLSSNVLSGSNPNDVVAEVTAAVAKFPTPPTISIDMTGEQEQQKETQSFLGNALLTSLGLILLILVIQFNSLSKPIIILTEIFFSIIGVLLGIVIFDMQISIIMTGVGIVALAGIVVRNGILLVEFSDLLREQGMELREAVIEAGRTRMTPVILTASATILGLIPLAVGMNIDFVTLFTSGDPNLFFGGDSVAFWGPLSWTMIFGLSFATFLTLILVPAMYLISETLKIKMGRTSGLVNLKKSKAEKPGREQPEVVY
jgi:multidrug efflux pump